MKLEKPINNEIIFNINGSWIMKLTNKGIFFNKERYPNAKPDDFAQAVIEILENEFLFKFERKEPPYDRKTNQLQIQPSNKYGMD